jgi:hypothetical protein
MPRTTQDKEPTKRMLPGAKYDYLVPRQLLWDVCRAFDDCVCPAPSCTADHGAVEELRVLAGGPPMSKKIGHRMHGQGFRAEGWRCPEGHVFEQVVSRNNGTYCGDCGAALVRKAA